MKAKKTLAIFSPNQNAYSETFIQAHKNLPFNIKYYFGGTIPGVLEGTGTLLNYSLIAKIRRKFDKFNLGERALISSLRKEKVDFVLAEYGTTAADSLKIIKYLNLPLIVHFHGFDASVRSVIQQYEKKYQEVFLYASAIIAVSEKMYETLLELGCPKEKMILNYYGPKELFFNNEPQYLKPQFISVGRFVNKKAPYVTIFAFQKVLEQFPEATLIMVGQGELQEICKCIVRLLKLENNIEFVGICKPEEVLELFQDSIAFVQHSITAENGDSEGTPVAILEAQAARLPVISTYHAGIPDIVLHNETGLLTEEQDFEGMASNMMRILKEKGLSGKLGAAGRLRVKNNFSMKKHLGTIENIINAL